MDPLGARSAGFHTQNTLHFKDAANWPRIYNRASSVYANAIGFEPNFVHDFDKYP